MVDRITGSTMFAQAQQNLQASRARLAGIQEQATTMRTINRPSDDPAGAAESMRVRAEQRAITQYAANISDGMGWLSTADSALGQANGVMQKVRDLTVQGANAAVMSPASREALALELDQLQASLLSAANTRYGGRLVFAGTSDAAAAFAPDFAFTGVAGTSVDRRVSPSATVRVDADGAAAFGTGAGSAFALIGQVAADLRAGLDVSGRLTAIDSASSAILGEQTRIGSRYGQLERSKELNVADAGAMEARRASVEDVDLAKVVLELKTQETAYQTALAVTARALQPTLMSFLS